ncbi:Crp/Fnr family transcriptional regulator [Elioraea sp.]|uniref:Crp/Fnr family transcriptional regulator n=1 Tax=Elioraea sp. TaxID=2185103 RepID=UPI0025BC5633|nr:Crp/Fnr family transcriptional regulator [Elioraea sp.]
MAEHSTLALLRRTPLFANTGERVLSRILTGSITRQVAKNAPLFTEGDPVKLVNLVLIGQVALTATGAAGQRTVIALLGEGDLVVAPAMLLGLRSPVGAVATSASRVLALDAALMRAEIAAEPALADAVLAMVSRQWWCLIEQIKDLKLHDSRTRVARWLAENAKGTEGAPVKLGAPKAMLARNLGMTPESFSRALASLEAAGAIAAAGSSIAILDRGLLDATPPLRHS